MKEFKGEKGASAVELACVLALIALVAVPTLSRIGWSNYDAFVEIAFVTGGTSGVD